MEYYGVVEQIVKQIVLLRQVVVVILPIDEDIILVLLHHCLLLLLLRLLLYARLQRSSLLLEKTDHTFSQIAADYPVEMDSFLLPQLAPLHLQLELLCRLRPLHHPKPLLLHKNAQYLQNHARAKTHLVQKTVPPAVRPRQKHPLLRKVLPQSHQLVNRLVLPEVEIGKVRELLRCNQLVERVCMMSRFERERTAAGVLPLTPSSNKKGKLLALSGCSGPV